MRILMLQGSPRKGGNTDVVLTEMASRLREAGATVSKIYLGRLGFSGCTECFACQKRADRPNCSLDDDMQKVYKRMLAADMVVFATPVFCWGPTAQLKAVLDRCYAFCKFQEDGSYNSLLRGKRCALVTTAGGTKDDGADLVVDSYRRFTKFMGLRSAGELVCALLTSPDETANNARMMARARRFAERLVRPKKR
jgi:multimeric flavodoxin WrbA